MHGTVILKHGREKPVRNRHPWIFSGAIRRIEGSVEDGDLVRVVDSRGRYLATGYLNRRSQIVVRLLTWNPEEEVDNDFWRRRLVRAGEGRARLAEDPATNAYRLVHAEADSLPGLIVDRYGEYVLLRPSVANNLLLWLAGPLLLLLGAGASWAYIRRSRPEALPEAQAKAAPLSDDERKRVEELLRDD